MRLTISKKLFTGFMAVLLVLVVTIGISYTQISNVDRKFTDLIDDKANKLIMIQQLNVSVKKEMAGLRGYLLLRDEASLQNFTNAHTEFKKLTATLEGIVKHPEGIVLLTEIIDLENKYYFSSNNSIKLMVKGETKKALDLVSTEGQNLIAQFDQKAEAFTAFQQKLLVDGEHATSDEVDKIKSLILILGIAAVLIGVAVSWIVGRKISKPVVKIAAAAEAIAAGDLTAKDISVKGKDEIGDLARSFQAMSANLRELIHHVGHNAEQVAASAEQLSATSEQASNASEQIAATMQEVSSDVSRQFHHVGEASRTINEMSAGVQQIAGHAHSVAATASKAYERAAEGGDAAQTAVRQMGAIHETVTGLAALIQTLNERSTEIGGILKVISEIAKQTNILSLNAGIEAARAGEQGRGFAVVAVEIRNLAEFNRRSPPSKFPNW
ncbi:methyl-accepting chemotaxis protein [Paenibacillus sp. LHD-117]|uniref:methyl-accepting chemotaxis protein n=1 Tax=Paenibacillus sp. LHD-117 TaxID=3071412 RepID=UPI0027DF912E|nr:methyl-accepting chemotaxis protein [Paenibacillus sp. LHD-117]MDQ6419545.1 methyl-accepting chemotaxis protein [Paenibacillus sp. LHD-117]